MPPPNRPLLFPAPTAAFIGIFDSGLGGLSVLRAARVQLPGEAFLYIADSRYAPYGERTDAFIVERTLAIGTWLAAQGAKALVVACNTATAQSIATLRQRFDMPVVGVEPGLKPALQQSKKRIVGVLATQATLRSTRFHALLERYGSNCQFLCQPGHGLADAVERGDTGSAELRARLQGYLTPMLAAGADTLVLGCTHYPFLSATINQLTQGRLTLIDTSDAIAHQLAHVLDLHGLRAPAAPQPALRLCSTNDGAHLHALSASLLGLSIPVEPVTILPPCTPAANSEPS